MHLFVLLLLIGEVFCLEDNLTDDTLRYWNLKNPETNDFLAITCQKGYKIDVKVTDFSVNGNGGDYLLIKSGKNAEDDGSGIVLTYHLSTERHYVINSNYGYLYFHKGNDPKAENVNFNLEYRRIGELEVTTIEPTEPTVDLPTAKPEQKTDITVYIGGKHYSEYDNKGVQLNLKQRIGYMATRYCDINNIVPKDTISDENVLLKGLKRCPLTYPDKDYCVSLTFAVPIHVDEVFGYQLNTSHLEQMWNTLANSLLDDGMSKYTIPNNGKATTWWIVLSAIVLIGIFIVSIVVKYFAAKSYKTIKRKNSDTREFAESTRESMFYGPDPMQITPQIFDNMYTIHEPGTPTVISGNANKAFLNDDDDHELEVDEEKFQPKENQVFVFDNSDNEEIQV